MPKKPIDEDRARRRAALEQKRAARKAAKAATVAPIVQTTLTTTTTTDGKTASTASRKEQNNVESLLFTLPDESLRRVYTYLTAADVGRTIQTCRRCHQILAQTTTISSLLLSRLHVASNMQLCTESVEAKKVWEDAKPIDPTTKNNKRQSKKLLPPPLDVSIHHFPAYLRFLEDSNHPHRTIIACSPEHSICRSSDALYSWGVGRRGQLGHGKRQDERKPRTIPFASSVTQIAAAGGGLVRVAHTLLLTNAGRVYSFGTGQYGALGHGYSAAKQLPDCLRPTLIRGVFTQLRITHVAAGELHSAAVTSDGDVYTWGDGFCGQLGHGDKRPCVEPKHVVMGGLDEECVAMVACGSRHTLVVTEDGECWSMGLGHFGVLGRSYTPFEYDADAAVVALAGVGADENEDTVSENEIRLAAVRIDVDRPAPPPPPVGAAEELRAQLDLIANLSLEDSSDQCIPKRIESFAGKTIVSASAGHRHSLFLDNVGTLYASGSGRCGCLGMGDTQSRMYPTKVALDDHLPIRRMSAGVDMSMAATATGEVYAWGKTDQGRIGLGLEANHVVWPRRVVDAPFPAVDVVCGYVHSLVVGVDGRVWTCGEVGVEGEADGQQLENTGKPRIVEDLHAWHRMPEPESEQKPAKKERWKKYGKYEVKGRSKMMEREG